MILLLLLIGAGVVTLAHTAPFPFLLEYLGPDRSVWHMPRSDGMPTVYLTYDDGPNPTATPALLDTLAAADVRATFFVIPDHVTAATGPILRRMHDEGHAIALHSGSRRPMFRSPGDLAARLATDAARIRASAGGGPCPLFRPHAGWRGGAMYDGLERADYRLAGWSFGMWDWNWWRPSDPTRLADRLAGRASDGDIIVMHDGHHRDPRADRQATVEATAQLIPLLRARGFGFGQLCEVSAAGPR
jgi:peptidoglycan/xylan/chitin deacetylase (PgdA/CDA1 family)